MAAIVTGSTSGIGRALAEALAEAGADVMLNGLGNADEIEALRAGIEREHGVRALYHPADMTRPGEIAAMVTDASTVFGRLDILVNNAGIQHVSRVEDFPAEQWDRIVAINLSSAFHATKAAVPLMKAAGRGRIVNLASVHGLVASPFKSAYVASKHGVLGFTKAVALELAETAITCNAICPGFVKTRLVEDQIADQAKAHGKSEDEVIRDVILASQPSKRFIETDQIAGLLLYLVSEAGAGVTGAALTVDGGWSAR
jgi:3-hydroxybutyrate dehydrogenase